MANLGKYGDGSAGPTGPRGVILLLLPLRVQGLSIAAALQPDDQGRFQNISKGKTPRGPRIVNTIIPGSQQKKKLNFANKTKNDYYCFRIHSCRLMYSVYIISVASACRAWMPPTPSGST
jgi:hypothetical protein